MARNVEPLPRFPQIHAGRQFWIVIWTGIRAHQARAEIHSNYAARLKEYRQAEKEFEHGFIAMVALTESGSTECRFSNTWLWLLD